MNGTPAAAAGTAGSERRALSHLELAGLLVLAMLPLLSIAIRILVLPGVDNPVEGLRPIGDQLDQLFSLSGVPASLRNHTLYLLLIPTAATIVSLARLTFGLRVLAFRSILISVAFHQSGFLASLLLISLAMGAVLVMRPWLRHIELPYFARMAVILSILAAMMVAVIVLAPFMRSDIAWGVIAFPVIALGFLSEGVANSVDRHHFIRAWWTALNTIAIATFMAIVFWIPALRSFLLRFPEIVLTQTIGVVLIAKYLDLRIFQHWDDEVMRALRAQAWVRGLHRVAVIRNRLETDERSRLALRSVQKIVDGLRDSGYKVKVMEGDESLPRELRDFFPVDAATGMRDGIVMNLAQGMRGDASITHVPAILEMYGLAYTGPTPFGHAMTFDRVASRVLMQQAGIPTPKFHLVPTHRGRPPADLPYPCIVAPRHELDWRPAIVSDRRQFLRARRKLRRSGIDEACVEEYVAGRQISAALLGNEPIEWLPLVELDADGEKICPAPLDDVTARRIREHARAAFRACGCRDYARVDIRIGEANELWVMEVKTLGILASQGAFVRAAYEAGYSFPALLSRIVEVTRKRAANRPRLEALPTPTTPALVPPDPVSTP